MNKSMIRYLLSKLLLIEACLLLVPVVIAVIYQEPAKVFLSLGLTIGILLILGGVGIQNVQERLALYFGEQFKMEYDSVENSYTKVYLTIPVSN